MDFPRESIEVDSHTSFWGPLKFSFDKSIPTEDAIQFVDVTSIHKESGDESTEELIEPGSLVIRDRYFTIRVKYPGDTLHGNHWLLIELTLASGAKPKRFMFGYFVVR